MDVDGVVVDGGGTGVVGMWRMIEARGQNISYTLRGVGGGLSTGALGAWRQVVCREREPLYFGGVTGFEAVWKGLGEQDMAVIFGVLVGMLVGFSNLSVKQLFLDLFYGIGSGRELHHSCVSK